jgi:hypothetical protein
MEYKKAKIIMDHALKFIPKIKFIEHEKEKPIHESTIHCEDKITNVLYLIDELYSNEVMHIGADIIKLKIHTDWGPLIFNLIKA